MEARSWPLFTFPILFALSMCQPPTEQKLHNFLLKDYNPLIRPSGVNGSLLTVRLGMRLSQILDIQWTDLRLKWNEEDFEGIDKTHIPAEHLWRPDILLYNNADGNFDVPSLIKAAIFSDGTILWEPPAIYKSYCPINVEFFPFDQQECFMKFSSWTYDGIQLDLRHVWEDTGVHINNDIVVLHGVDLCDYAPNVEWDVINVTARRAEKFYPCCLEPYPYITFNITVRRRTLFYTINLIMPCVSISCLAILVFYLPSDSGEKITLSISIVVALTVFFLLLADINPPTSIVIPLIGKYLLFTMVVVVLSIFLTVYTLSVHWRSPRTDRMPQWVKRVFLKILPKILFIKRPQYDMKKKKKQKKPKAPPPEANGDSDPIIYVWKDQPNYENLRRRGVSEPVDDLSQYPQELRESLKGVKYIAEHLRQEDEEGSEVNDWHYVAIVMDRLFLWIFTISCLCGTLGIFMNAPTLYEPTVPLDRSSFTCTG